MESACVTNPNLLELLAKAKDWWDKASPQVRADMERRQRRSYVASEMAMGSDADESAYRVALENDDKAEIARLHAEGELRREAALKYMDEHGL